MGEFSVEPRNDALDPAALNIDVAGRRNEQPHRPMPDVPILAFGAGAPV